MEAHLNQKRCVVIKEMKCKHTQLDLTQTTVQVIMFFVSAIATLCIIPSMDFYDEQASLNPSLVSFLAVLCWSWTRFTNVFNPYSNLHGHYVLYSLKLLL